MANTPPSVDANFCHYESLEAIRSEFSYTDDAIAGPADFNAVLGYYTLKQKLRCSLRNCHTQHNFGYVVRLQNATTINIGNVCGKNAFGESFEVERRLVDRFKDLKALRESFNIYSSKISLYQKRIEDLEKDNWNTKKISEAVRDFMDAHPLSGRLYDRAIRKDFSVRTVRQRSNLEVEQMRLVYPQKSYSELKYEEVSKGLLVGLNVLTEDSVTLLASQVLSPIEKLKTVDRITSTKDLKKLAKELASVEEALEKCEKLAMAASRFFTQGNFGLITYLARSDTESAEVVRFKWDFSEQQSHQRRKSLTNRSKLKAG